MANQNSNISPIFASNYSVAGELIVSRLISVKKKNEFESATINVNIMFFFPFSIFQLI